MLSKIDIEKQIGKGINIVPFKKDNIKENSINFTISNMAWTIQPKDTGNGYNKAKPASNAEVITLYPHSTTVVYTEEVIALNNKYGGTFHAKVGIVSKGIVFSSTMIGPSYCGHLMISIQNPTDKKIKLNVGETFISLILYKLDTKINKLLTNSNTGGHTEKFALLGIENAENEIKILEEDWKKNINTIQEKLESESDYKSLKAEIKKRELKYYVILAVFFLIVLVIAFVVLKVWVLNESKKSVLGSVTIAGIVELIAILTGFLKKALKMDI